MQKSEGVADCNSGRNKLEQKWLQGNLINFTNLRNLTSSFVFTFFTHLTNFLENLMILKILFVNQGNVVNAMLVSNTNLFQVQFDF